MDRRRLLIASGVLPASALLPRWASAQSQLPPARQTAQDGPPPTSEDYPQYRAPAAAYQQPTYQRPTYQQPSYSQPGYPPAYPQSGDQDPAYRDPNYRQPEGPPPPDARPTYPAQTRAETYSRDELVNSVSDFLGVTAEAAGSATERIFRDNGRPTGYIAGEEGSAAFVGGLRYGKGLLYMKGRRPETVYWQGPSVGFDWGGNASRSFTLCYNLQYPDAIYRRFPGVEGTAYFIGGLGVNYQRAEDITLAPMRAGVGLRLGANIGYLSYSRRRHWIPL